MEFKLIESLNYISSHKDYNTKSGDRSVPLYIDMPGRLYSKPFTTVCYREKYPTGTRYVRYSMRPRWMIFSRHASGEAVAGEASIHDTLKEGDLMLFTDSDLGIEGSIIIDTLIIKGRI